MVIGLLTFQLKTCCAVSVPSLAVMVAVKGPLAEAPMATVPVMIPVLGLIANPGGSPIAAKFRVAPGVTSPAVMDRETELPSVLLCVPGLLSAGLTTAMSQVRERLSMPLFWSLSVTVG